MQKHIQHNKGERHSSLEKYTSHIIWKGSEGLLKVLLWEGVGDRIELQYIDPHSHGHNSVSGLLNRGSGGLASLGHVPHSSIFSPTATAQSGAWGPTLLGADFLCRIFSPTDWTSCAPSYIIIRHPPSSCGRHKSHSLNPFTVKVISRYSSTGCTCYLHRCISYFDSLAGVNMQHSSTAFSCHGDWFQVSNTTDNCCILVIVGHLSPITKTIQVRRTRHAGHCWRSSDELISDVLLWTPTHGRAKAGRPARTYIQQLCEDTGCCPEDLLEAMNDREEWRERVRDIRTTRTTWWWWWWY